MLELLEEKPFDDESCEVKAYSSRNSRTPVRDIKTLRSSKTPVNKTEGDVNKSGPSEQEVEAAKTEINALDCLTRTDVDEAAPKPLNTSSGSSQEKSQNEFVAPSRDISDHSNNAVENKLSTNEDLV